MRCYDPGRDVLPTPHSWMPLAGKRTDPKVLRARPLPLNGCGTVEFSSVRLRKAGSAPHLSSTVELPLVVKAHWS